MNSSGKSKLYEKRVRERERKLEREREREEYLIEWGREKERKEKREEWVIYLEQVLVFVSCIVTCQRDTRSSVTHFILCNASSNETLLGSLSPSHFLFFSLSHFLFFSLSSLLDSQQNITDHFPFVTHFFHRVEGVEISEWAREHLRSQIWSHCIKFQLISFLPSFVFLFSLSFFLFISVSNREKERKR